MRMFSEVADLLPDSFSLQDFDFLFLRKIFIRIYCKLVYHLCISIYCAFKYKYLIVDSQDLEHNYRQIQSARRTNCQNHCYGGKFLIIIFKLMIQWFYCWLLLIFLNYLTQLRANFLVNATQARALHPPETIWIYLSFTHSLAVVPCWVLAQRILFGC